MIKKKIIVTGGNGFIGSHLIFTLLKKKFKVLNIDKISYCSRKLSINDKNYKFIKCDITNQRNISSIFNQFKPDIILNLAAESHVDRSIESPKKFFETNLIGTINLLNEIIKNKKIRIVHISTDEVFGSLNFNDKAFNEKSFYNPQSPYSASKAASDHAVRAYGNTFNIDYIITNCSNNYGPYQYPEKFIPVIIKNLNNNKKIPIYGSGRNIRDWIHVQDHVDAILLCMLKGKSKNTYLIGSDNEISNINLTKKIINLFNKFAGTKHKFSDKIKFIKDRKGHDLRYAINSAKIKKKLKWKSKISFDDGLRETVKFYCNNKKNLNEIFNKDNWLKKKYK